MEINPAFDHYMDQYFDYAGEWDAPSRCGLKVVRRKDGKTLAIATELYRQNPGTPVTEWVAPLATAVMHSLGVTMQNFIFVEHTPDLRSKLTFYEETFDLVSFEEQEGKLVKPSWKRLDRTTVDKMMEE